MTDEQPTQPTQPLQPGAPATGPDEAPTRVMPPGTPPGGPGGYGGGEPPFGDPGEEFPEGGGGGNRRFLVIILTILAAIAVAAALVLLLGDDDSPDTTDEPVTTEELATDTVTEVITETSPEPDGTNGDDGGNGGNGGGNVPPPEPDEENPPLFRLPEADIHCSMDEMAVSCDVIDFNYDPPPKPTDCPADWGGRISLGAENANFVCFGDALPSFDTDVELDHGISSTVGDITCTSDGDAVYCINNATGFGFSVSPDAYQFLDGPS